MNRPRLAFLALLVACGGVSSTAPLMLTCDIRGNSSAQAHGQCQEWRGDVTDSTNSSVNFELLCTSTLDGTVLTGPCPDASKVGLCTKHPSVAERVVLHYYYAPDYDAASARANCTTQGGSFSE